MKKDVIVKKSKINGKGVFANKDFKKGETVMKWDLSIKLTKKEVQKLPEKEKHYIYFAEGKYILEQVPERYVNHSCNPNTTVKNLSDVAVKEIKKGEEITADYTKEETMEFEIKCSCGSKNCKGTIKGGTKPI